MRFSTLLLALIPAIALAAPIPAPAFGFDCRSNDLNVVNFQVRTSLLNLDLAKGAVQSIINQTPGGPVGTAASSALNNINQAQIALNAIQRASNACRNPQQLDHTILAQNLLNGKKRMNELSSLVTSARGRTDIDTASIAIDQARNASQVLRSVFNISLASVGITVPLKITRPQ